MTIKELHYIHTIYREKSFSKAAALLYMSQPALSIIVRRVERELGITIFDRGTIPLSITESGEALIQAAREIGEIDNDLMKRLSDIKALESGHLSIGGSSFFCARVLSEKIVKFRKMYPGIQIDLYESNTDILKERLLDGRLDLIMEAAIYSEDGMNSCKVMEEAIVLGVPKHFPVNERLAEFCLTEEQLRANVPVANLPGSPECRPVSLGHFRGEPFIFLRRGNDIFSRGMEMCRKAGFRPEVVIYLDQMMTAHSIAARGVGCLFLRGWMVPHLQDKEKLCYYAIDDPQSRRPLYFAWKKGRYMTKGMRDFLKLNDIIIPEDEN